MSGVGYLIAAYIGAALLYGGYALRTRTTNNGFADLATINAHPRVVWAVAA